MNLSDKLLKKEKLNDFIEALKKDFSVLVPVKDGELIFFKGLKDGIKPCFDYSIASSHPLKSIFLPQTEELFRFKIKKNEIEILESPINDEKRVVIGARPCEAKGLTIIDKPFLEWEPRDEAYLKRRENTIIISLLCPEPEDTCFCTSLGYNLEDGSDILIVELEDFYYLKVITEKGRDITSSLDKPKEEKEFSILCKKGISLDIKPSFDSPIWKEISQKCLGCGICTYLCPTCYCFDIQDEKNRRFRCWDSCSFSYFTKMATHQPRPEQFQRYRNRVMHKFSYFPERFGEFACVGCGRCIKTCPVGMDITEVIEKSGVRGQGSGVSG
ncbi:MAG: 4Fe-4S dicluster domain-containing protein [bacterium]